MEDCTNKLIAKLILGRTEFRLLYCFVILLDYLNQCSQM